MTKKMRIRDVVLNNGCTLVLKSPDHPAVEYKYQKDEDPEVRYVGEFEHLDMHVWGKNQSELRKAIDEEIAFLWAEYAKAPDESLSDGARVLKYRMREMFEEHEEQAHGFAHFLVALALAIVSAAISVFIFLAVYFSLP